MAGERILVVEDELIVAQDLQDMLKRLGYRIAGTASSGEEAIEESARTHPDLVLMDIRLKGEMDGIDAAAAIWSRQGIPVTYLTAYADESTLERAKATMPFGYILKPFEERDLRTSVEMALYKHGMESVLGKMEGWYALTLGSLSDAIIAANNHGGVTFMNPAAESLTGCTLREIFGKNFNDVFKIVSDKDPASVPPSGNKRIGVLLAKDGQRIRAEFTTTPIKEKEGEVTGSVVVIRPLNRPEKPTGASNQRSSRAAL